MKRYIFILVSLLFAQTAVVSALETTTVIVGKGSRGPYRIGEGNLISNSVIINRNNINVDTSLFSVEYPDGIIRFSEPVPVGESLMVTYQSVPLSLPDQYYLHSMDTEYNKTNVGQVTPAKIPAATHSDISIKGSKGFSVRAGEGDDGLSQSLNLTVEGELVKGLRTSAHISDKSSGKSNAARRLNELDKIYIEAESENFKGTFGDFDYVHQRGGLLNFHRKLTGIQTSIFTENQNINGAAAFFPGEYTTQTITGIDGLAGPYYLTDGSGRQGIVVLPGSERIYLDGELQSRGSGNDYTIDYESGAVQFASFKIIRNESRIRAEFEIAREDYSRSFYSFAGETKPVGYLRFFTGLIQEGDNKNSPKSFEMTGDNRNLLSVAGGNRLTASKSGAVYVGNNQGDYDIFEDSDGNSYYVYSGPDLGEYDVVFSFIAIGQGSYNFLGAGIYEYVGMGSGNYEPVIILPLPEQKRYGTFGAEITLSDSSLKVSGEMFGSVLDQNTISTVDKKKNGIAGLGTLTYKKPLIKENLSAELNFKTRRIGSDASFPGRIDGIERYREYDLLADSSYSGENLQEAQVILSDNGFNSITGLFGFLSRPGITNRKRVAGDMNLQVFGPLYSYGRLDRVSGDRTWQKRSGGLRLSVTKLQPEISIRYEIRDGAFGFKYYEYIMELPVTITQSVLTRTNITWRDEKLLDDVWRDKFKSISVQQAVEFISGKKGISGEFNGAYYKKKYDNFDGVDSDQKSGWGRINYNDARGRGAISLNESVSSARERLRAKNYIFVGNGLGEYRFEDGEYIEDPDGDYILRIDELGEGINVTDIGTNISWSVSPFKIASLTESNEKFVGRLTVEGELNYNLTKSVNKLIGEDFIPWKSGGLDNVVSRDGQINIRVYYYPPRKKQRIKYNLSRSYRDGRPYANEIINESIQSDEISWGFPAGARLDFLMSVLLKNKSSSLNGFEYDINSREGSVSADYRMSDDITIQLMSSYEDPRQTVPEISTKIPSLKLGLVQDLKIKGRIIMSGTYSRLFVNPKGSYVPYQIAGGKKEGDNFEGVVSADFRISKTGKFETSYRYEKFAKRPDRQSLNIEFTVLFL